MKLSISEEIKGNGPPEIADAVCELQGKCVICCSEHSSTARPIINGTKSRLENTRPHHYEKMWLGKVNHKAFLFQK